MIGRVIVIVMTNAKISVTLSPDQLKEVRALVKAGRSPNVSAFIQHAVKVALWDAAEWRRMLDEALVKTGGPLTDKERAWADSILNAPPRKRKGKAA